MQIIEHMIAEQEKEGWKDGKLGVAHEMINDVLNSYNEERRAELARIRDLLEDFDYDTECQG